MAVTVSGKNYTQLSSCDTTASGGTWGGNGIGADTGLFREGAGSIYATLKSVGDNDLTFTPTAPVDLSGTKHLRIWFMFTGLKQLNTDAYAGIQFGITDGTNTGWYNVSGSTTYLGGWYNLVVDVSRAVDSGIKPTNMNAITIIYVRVNLLTAPKNATNTWIDNLCVCDGLTAYGDLSGVDFSLTDILNAENAITGGWGVIRKISGVYYLTGSLNFGDTSGTTITRFKDTSQVIVFEDRKVNTSLYGILADGNATNKTNFQLGNKSGSSGISGCTIRTESNSQTPKFYFTASSLNVSTMFVYGCTLVDAGTVTLPVSAANKEVVSTNFEQCAEVLPATCKMQYCNFISMDSRAIRFSSTSHNVTDCTFIACPQGVEAFVVGTFEFNNLKFSGCTKDIENTVTAATASTYTTQDNTVSLNNVTGISAVGQSFNGNGGQLSNAKFYLQKVSVPAGNMYAKLYAASGSSPYIPTGAVLATSDPVIASSISVSLALVEFQFTGTNVVTLTGGTNNYVIVLEYTSGDDTNYIKAAYHGTTPSHTGNYSEYISSWIGTTVNDLYHIVYTGGVVIANCTNTSNPTTYLNTGNGSTEIKNSVTLKVTCKNEAGLAIEGVRIRIEKQYDGSLVSNGYTLSTGIYQDTGYKYLGDLNVKIIARLRGYKNTSALDTIYSTGLNVPFTMMKDKSVNLP